jgi:hypothetical protein
LRKENLIASHGYILYLSRLWTVSIPSPAFVGVTVEEVGVAALLEDGGHLLGLVVVQLDLPITLITTPHSHLSSFCQKVLVH